MAEQVTTTVGGLMGADFGHPVDIPGWFAGTLRSLVSDEGEVEVLVTTSEGQMAYGTIPAAVACRVDREQWEDPLLKLIGSLKITTPRTRDEPRIVCMNCGATVCEVEHNDYLAVLVRSAGEHVTTCEPRF